MRGHTLRAFAHATRDLFGEHALRELLAKWQPLASANALSVEDHEWVSASDIVTFCEEAFDGPIARDPVALRAWSDRMMDHGFGRVRRLLLNIATPKGVLRRASELWRDEFTDGRLVAYSTSPQSGVASLYEHVFIDTELMRDVLAETFRYTLELAGARGAREQHILHGNGAFTVELNW